MALLNKSTLFSLVLCCILTLIFGSSTLAQIPFRVISVTNFSNDDGKNGYAYFGDALNVSVKMRKQSSPPFYPSQMLLRIHGADNYPITSQRIPTLEQTAGDSIQMMYTFLLPDKMTEGQVAGQLERNALWQATYRRQAPTSWYNERLLHLYLQETIPTPQTNPSGYQPVALSKPVNLRYFNWFTVTLASLVVLIIGLVAGFVKHNALIRDDINCKCEQGNDCPEKNTFSLSKFQFWLWTTVIFLTTAVIWVITNHVPNYSIYHLAIFGISASSLIVSKSLEKGSAKSIPFRKYSLSGDGITTEGGCSRGLFIDLISDQKSLSMTRLQNLLATLFFITVFISSAFNNLSLPSIDLSQLTLMGMSSVIYLIQKQKSIQQEQKWSV